MELDMSRTKFTRSGSTVTIETMPVLLTDPIQPPTTINFEAEHAAKYFIEEVDDYYLRWGSVQRKCREFVERTIKAEAR